MREIRIVPYTAEYKAGVIRCLQRNYEWMSSASDSYMEMWLKPITEYRWTAESEVGIDEYPFKYGAILLDNKEVVGYLGMIVARRMDSGKEYICGSPSTWAIDEGYRVYLFKAMKLLMQGIYIYIDFSSNKSMLDVYCKVFQFEEFSRTEFRIAPIPSVVSNLQSLWIKEATSIKNCILKREFLDHQQFYGVKLVCFEKRQGNENCNIFYKRYNEDSYRVRILKIDNPKFFAENCQEIVWKIMQKEFYDGQDITEAYCSILRNAQARKRICMECDKTLLEGNELNHPMVAQAEIVRLYKICNNQEKPKIDFLYSEISNLSCYI